MTEELFQENLFICQNLGEIPQEQIMASLAMNKFLCIRGLIAESIVQKAKQALRERFSRANDHPSIGESPTDVQGNFQKLSVGFIRGKHHIASSYSYGRLLRVFFNPLWAEDIYAMHGIFRILSAVRNQLIGKPINFAIGRVDEGLWTASRILQYPIGGGFIQPHRDTTQAAVVKAANLNYYQVFTILSKKGEDFERGGGFLETPSGYITVDDHVSLGDIVIYDASTLHGVEDIDPHKVLDLNTFSGRLSAFVSLYKKLV